MSAAAVATRGLPVVQEIPVYNDDQDDDNYTVAETVATSLSNYSVPLSRLSRHSIKLRHTSSFPSILGLYHAPIEEETNKESLMESGKKKKVKKRKETDFETLILRRHQKEGIYGLYERTKKKQTEATSRSSPAHLSRIPEQIKKKKKKRHREITFDPKETTLRAIRIEAVAREQMDRYETYIKNLKKKVESQREERKQHEDLFAEKLKRMQIEEQKKKMVRKRPKQDFINDTKHMKNESKFGKMVKLEDSLKKRGMLKNRSDVDKFWSDFGHKSINNVDIFTQRDPLTEVPDPKDWVATRHRPITNQEENLDMYRSKSKQGNTKKTTALPPLGQKKKKKKVKSKEEPIFHSEREPELLKSYSY